MNLNVDENLTAAIHVVEVELNGMRHKIHVPAQDAWVIRDIFESHEYVVPPAFLRPDPVVIDFGAHVGTFALYARSLWDPSAIHCFEPSPASVELLRKNLAAIPNVVIHPTAVGDCEGEIGMCINRNNSTANTLHAGMIGSPHERERVTVPIRKAQSEWDQLGYDEVDVLKIDVEGSEIDVLESLGERLDHVRVIMIEYHKAEYRRLVDALLPRHLLFGMTVFNLSRGTVKYVRENLFERIS